MNWQVLLESDPETGTWTITCPALPGVTASASTRDGACEAIKQAIAARPTLKYRANGRNGTSTAEGMVVYQRQQQYSLAFEMLDELGIPADSRGTNHLAFGWYGGKYSHLEWLLPLLPPANHYCEPFAGSAAVLLNREPSPVETYNDIDGEVVNFFQVLRDQKQDLIEAILLTPFSREELTRACREETQNLTSLERARRFYVRARQTRTGLAQTASPGRWATCRNTSRRGMGGAVSRWLGLTKKVSRNPLGEWGHADSSHVRVKSMRDYAYLTLRRHGSPMHFTEVAAQIGKLLFQLQQGHRLRGGRVVGDPDVADRKLLKLKCA